MLFIIIAILAVALIGLAVMFFLKSGSSSRSNGLDEPEELVGKTLVAIVNLPPRKMMGLDSCGMLISAVHTEQGEEKLHLIMVDDAIPAGAKLC